MEALRQAHLVPARYEQHKNLPQETRETVLFRPKVQEYFSERAANNGLRINEVGGAG